MYKTNKKITDLFEQQQCLLNPWKIIKRQRNVVFK